MLCSSRDIVPLKSASYLERMKMAKRFPKKPRLPRPITVTEIIFEN
jgi:hypothetical protein